MLLGNLQRHQPFAGIVQPPKEAQSRIIQRLQPKRSAVNPCRGQCRIVRRLDRAGVAFEGNLDPVGKAPQPLCLVQQCTNQRGRHQAGSAAAEEHAVQRLAASFLRFVAQIGQQGLLPSGKVHSIADVAVEIAIGTLCEAERPMDVKRAGHGCYSQGSARDVKDEG